MKPTPAALGAPRGPLRKRPVWKPGEPSRSLEMRKVPRFAAEPSWVSEKHSARRRINKQSEHPFLSAMAARVVASLPNQSFNVDTGHYTPRDSNLPALRGASADCEGLADRPRFTQCSALPVQTPEVHIPVFPLMHGWVQEGEMTLHERLASRRVVPVPSDVFDVQEKPALIHTAVVSHLASLRSHLATNKGRAAIAATTRKMLPQKGTGRARRSDRSAPHLRGGGRAFPKTPMRNWKRQLNGNAWVAAMCSALSMRWRDGGIVCIDGIPLFNGEGVPGFLPGIPVPVMLQKSPEQELRRLLQDRGLYGGTGTLFLLGHDVAQWHEGHFRLRSVHPDLKVTTHFVKTCRLLRKEGVDVKRALDVNILELLRYRRILFDERGLGDLIARLQSDRGLLGSEVWPMRLASSATPSSTATSDTIEVTRPDMGSLLSDEALHVEADRYIKSAKKLGGPALDWNSAGIEQIARLGHVQRV